MVNFHKGLMYKTAQFQNVGSSFIAYKLQKAATFKGGSYP